MRAYVKDILERDESSPNASSYAIWFVVLQMQRIQ